MDIQQLKQFKILIIGDSCEDIYHYGSCSRLSPEAPVPVFKELDVLKMRGMSSNVFDNLKSFNFDTRHITNTENIYKHRFVDKRSKQHLLRVDSGDDQLIKKVDFFEIEKHLDVDAVIISDYNKGFLRAEDCYEICALFEYRDIPLFVDSKKKNLNCFHNCWLKINQEEFNNAISFPCQSKVLVTMGADGVRLGEKRVPADKVEVFDVCGAGDVFLATLVYYFLSTKDIQKAIPYANKFASYSVTKSGTYKITKEDIKEILKEEPAT